MRHRCKAGSHLVPVTVGLILVMRSIASAQTPDPAPSSAQNRLVWTLDFAREVQGRTLIVTTIDGQEHRGVFKVDPSALVAAGSTPGVQLPFDHIARIEVMKPNRHPVILGTVAGLGIGIWIAVDWYDHSSCDAVVDQGCGTGVGYAVLSTAAGIAGGAVLKHVLGKPTVIFDASGQSKTVALAPILTPTRRGVVFSLTWR
jgi:hypothetical protein